MGKSLEIRDGDPWWISPDIWVVPGDDPNGQRRAPVAGHNNYVWAKVKNNLKDGITDGRVDFFWSNPTTGVLRSNSTPIGSAFVDLDAGEAKEVLCITSWVPTIVNHGHECVVAQVIHPAASLPNPIPDSFDPPAYEQVAQRNLTVINMETNFKLHLTLQISASKREPKKTLLTIVDEPSTLKKEVLESIGLSGLEPAKGALPEVGFIKNNSCEDQNTFRRLEMDVPVGQARAVHLQIKTNNTLSGYHLIHIVERISNRIVGGISFIITSQRR